MQRGPATRAGPLVLDSHRAAKLADFFPEALFPTYEAVTGDVIDPSRQFLEFQVRFWRFRLDRAEKTRSQPQVVLTSPTHAAPPMLEASTNDRSVSPKVID